MGSADGLYLIGKSSVTVVPGYTTSNTGCYYYTYNIYLFRLKTVIVILVVANVVKLSSSSINRSRVKFK